jgi:hypothetical protein
MVIRAYENDDINDGDNGNADNGNKKNELNK